VPEELALFARFPALADFPRVALGAFPTPVERVDGLPGAPDFWIKRDDLSGHAFGGNKVRSLEFLLSSVRPGNHVLTVGAEGSTHALATAIYAAQLGADTTVVTWRQVMNDDARDVAARMRSLARVVGARFTVVGMLRAMFMRLHEPFVWVPPGGTSPRGMLGHVNAGLEVAAQIERGEMPRPANVVIPLGTGGTAAGVALGLAIAGVRTNIVMARVVPRIVANRVRVRSHMRLTAELIEKRTGERVVLPALRTMEVVHEQYGGAYGRATEAGRRAGTLLSEARQITTDATYSAKALAAALALRSSGPTLFWHTFDGRWISPGDGK
jgi:D-cysteine desulfhydrase